MPVPDFYNNTVAELYSEEAWFSVIQILGRLTVTTDYQIMGLLWWLRW